MENNDFNEIDFSFDLNDEDAFISKKQQKTSFARIKRYKRPRLLRYDNAKLMAKEIGLIKKDESIFSLVSGNFICGDLIEAYLVENDLYAEEVIVATLSLSKDNVDSLRNLQLFGRTDSISLLISDYFFCHERKNGVEYIIEELSTEPFNFAAAGIHTKITLIKTKCGMNLVIHGSANLRSSRNLEQLVIENNEEIYNFNREWIVDLIDKYAVNNKRLRANKLWLTLPGQEKKKD